MSVAGPRLPPLLCPLTPGRAGTPCFLVPSAGTTPLSLVRLARSIAPPRPVHAFAYAGLEDDRPPHETLEAMAGAYVEELVAVAPHGPYLLSGHCLGGAVALDMALRLEARGARVSCLAMLDSIAPLLATEGPGPGDAELPATPDAFGPSLRSVLEGLVERTLRSYPALGPDVFERLRAMLVLHVDAGVRYRARPVRAPVHLLQTGAADIPVDDRWTHIAAGVLTRRMVPGDTFSMLRPPHVEAVGRILGRVLEEHA
ncbi:Dimodular nonribosomal peptide synthase [Burkholderiales bacterium]|nr:Dimodular nonribosomal peptide synthase [Burkholderiales bacterium]